MGRWDEDLDVGEGRCGKPLTGNWCADQRVRWYAKPEVLELSSQVRMRFMRGRCGRGHEGSVSARCEEHVESLGIKWASEMKDGIWVEPLEVEADGQARRGQEVHCRRRLVGQKRPHDIHWLGRRKDVQRVRPREQKVRTSDLNRKWQRVSYPLWEDGREGT